MKDNARPASQRQSSSGETGSNRDQGGLSDRFRIALRRLGATVAIITTQDESGRHGMTATAVTAVSMDPPSLLVNINRAAAIHDPLLAAGTFCVNLLDDGQREHCHVFSSAAEGEARFHSGHWGDHRGLPYLLDAQANIFCTVDKTMPYGTHTIIVARVDRAESAAAVSPLLYVNGGFVAAAGRPGGE